MKNIKLQSTKLKKRLELTLDVLTEHPAGSILSASGNRSQAKAAYRMLSNNHFDIKEVKKTYAEATVARIAEQETVLLIQDTTTNNLNTHKKTQGLGYCDEFNKGILLHNCLAITTEGVSLGILSQQTHTRPQKKDPATKSEKRQRPIEEKESYRWIEALNEANALIPPTVNAVNICDREGDFYEFYASAAASGYKVLVRLTHDRIIQDHQKALDYIKSVPYCGNIVTKIPRDTRNNKKSRMASLDISYSTITFKKPAALRSKAPLPAEITATAIHVIENEPPEGVEAIEWFLITTETVNNFEDAVRMVQYYVQRWKIERFHYVLKEGCEVEKVQERSFERQSSMIFLLSMVAVYIMSLTYMARTTPDTGCDAMFNEDEWKILYCAANKTKQKPETPYTIKEAVQYLARLGGFAGAPSDGDPGAKVIWRGLKALYTLLEYHEYL